ncbi:Transglutaminase-like superfamily protein [Posidoniimonas corsicana]|uniref:Transglutaminase-like superfamily protein n=1 Tax=Posidoniimonas corsicana TaxID=1938618 RepID=A0A5C5VGN7_9BACT|nr:transglutaminase family protein [Posidoniimonas corsicana]TWT37746.1 Transglutaminase-like superfamily protein [Posidoniimonas corsicana]
MSIHVALHHKTTYSYSDLIGLGPQVIRLRPAPHSRTPILSYSLRVQPDNHFLNWQQDPYGNYQARCVFPEKARELSVEVDLVASLSSINPFDFFTEPQAEEFPFAYDAHSLRDLKPYMALDPAGPRMHALLATVDRRPRKTIDFLVELNQRLQREIGYVVRLEPGVQTCEQTLELGTGSCRDSAWLLCQALRHIGFASRFVSGYLIQLVADQKSLDGPSGPEADFTDLHAWTEVYLPGAGWVGLDPTSGLLASEGHIPLACTPHPVSAAPITGAHDECDSVDFDFQMSVARVHEDPRVTKPYTEEEWNEIEALGHKVDERLAHHDVRLTMGGEPTFVSIDDMDGEEWQTAAVGPNKRRLGNDLLLRLKRRFGAGGLLHFGQGKWYPGESLPRWAMHCYWRKDGEPIWQNDSLFAPDGVNLGHTAEDAARFAKALAERLAVNPDHAIDAYEDSMYYAWRERRLPANVNPRDSKLEDVEERERIARVFEQGLTSAVGVTLPLQFRWWEAEPRWQSGAWVVRSDEMFLIPGDSPMGYRLPLQSLLYLGKSTTSQDYFERDTMEALADLPRYESLRRRHAQPALVGGGVGLGGEGDPFGALRRRGGAYGDGPGSWNGNGDGGPGHAEQPEQAPEDPEDRYNPANVFKADVNYNDPSEVVRTALCVEPRGGVLHVFMPPADRLEVYLDLVTAIEETAESLGTQLVIEGYLPPHDPRLQHIKVTPDPGVLEVNVHPAESWDELVDITTGVYEDARNSRLGTEKFDQDGSHTGTGGGNHVVMGGASVADSPWLRRPDLLKSFLTYWQNHPSLSYIFSGKFVGPTSQAPRVEEARADSLYELKIAFEQIQAGRDCPPWLVDRVFRHLLVDGTGNTHRSEFCIDKLFSPDGPTGRLGLVEFRAFEMPPHARMSLTQQLLLRALVARFWENPYEQPPVTWGTTLHDRWMLPHFIWQDFQDVAEEMDQAGFPIKPEWFAAHWEFRFPVIGRFTQRGVHVELRRAIEPWYVLGEEPGGGALARYVDSSVERLEVKVSGMTDPRYVLTCNGRRTPLHPTGVQNEYVAGVRYRAWQPPSCLHPTIPVHGPLVFDLVDAWMDRSMGGCQYHIGHPGGNNPTSFPVNALEAESRRATRFFSFGHTPGPVKIPSAETNPEFPLTLDLRRGGP